MVQLMTTLQRAQVAREAIRTQAQRNQAARAMTSAQRKGVNPYDSQPTQAAFWSKAWKDKARRLAAKEAATSDLAFDLTRQDPYDPQSALRDPLPGTLEPLMPYEDSQRDTTPEPPEPLPCGECGGVGECYPDCGHGVLFREPLTDAELDADESQRLRQAEGSAPWRDWLEQS